MPAQTQTQLPPDGLSQKEWETIRNHIDTRMEEAIYMMPEELRRRGTFAPPQATLKQRLTQIGLLVGVAAVGGIVGAAVHRRFTRKTEMETEGQEKEVGAQNRVRSVGPRLAPTAN